MANLRDDLDGVVYIGGKAYKAGDQLPDGADIAASLVATETKSEKTAPTRRSRSRKDD